MMDDAAKKFEGRSTRCFFFLFPLALASVVLWPNFSAQWGLIDDHWIVTVLGQGHSLPLSHLGKAIQSVPEIAGMGNYPRFQPVYILLRLLETFLWGDHPGAWYLLRVFLFAGTLALALWLAVEEFALLPGSFLALVFLAHRGWADIFARLGAAEAYSVPGLAVYCVAFRRLWGRGGTRWAILLAVSGVVALGSKENMLFLVPATALLLYRRWRRRQDSGEALIAGGLVIGFGLFVAVAVGLGLVNHGADFYNNSVAPTSRLQSFGNALFSLSTVAMEWPIGIPLLASLVAVLVVWAGGERTRRGWPAAHRLLLGQIILFFLWSFQVVFYDGKIPQGTRYDFPAILFVDLAYFSWGWSWLQGGWSLVVGGGGRVSKVQKYMVFGGAVLVFLVGRGPEVAMIYRAALANSQRTQHFTAILRTIVERTRRQPGAPLIIESHWVWDYEAIGSLRRYLSVYGVRNPLTVKLVGYGLESVAPGHETVLVKDLLARSQNGDFRPDNDASPAGEEMLPYYPISVYRPGQPCYSVSFSGESELECEQVGSLYLK